jgi:ribosomal protein S18 acetylase RimI-like enzyme
VDLMQPIAIAPFALAEELTTVLAVMEAAYGLDDSGTRQRERILLRHAGRDGLITRAARTPDGELVGFCYGFSSDPESWWDQQIRRHLIAAGNAGWLDHAAFELTELHVRPDHQRRGLGRRLITTVLGEAQQARALLSVRAGERPARRLYLDLGFADLTAPFAFGPGQPPYTVMGVALPLAVSRRSGERRIDAPAGAGSRQSRSPAAH